mmetsp:Transcript_40935/g.98723  ORF Transcript_40935/g.98723 Transcript_40935/m.98723 type:complete len:227 (+) Transcript_40935:897-1577(+)
MGKENLSSFCWIEGQITKQRLVRDSQHCMLLVSMGKRSLFSCCWSKGQISKQRLFSPRDTQRSMLLVSVAGCRQLAYYYSKVLINMQRQLMDAQPCTAHAVVGKRSLSGYCWIKEQITKQRRPTDTHRYSLLVPMASRQQLAYCYSEVLIKMQGLLMVDKHPCTMYATMGKQNLSSCCWIKGQIMKQKLVVRGAQRYILLVSRAGCRQLAYCYNEVPTWKPRQVEA